MKYYNSPLAIRMLNAKSSAVRDLLRYSKVPGMISLAGGLPASDLFDISGLKDAFEIEMNSGNRDAFQYGQTEGDPELRQQIAHFMFQRDIFTSADRIIITTGSQQALDLVGRIFLNPGDRILVERPTYLAALQVFSMADAQIHSVSGDQYGINVDKVEAELASNQIKAIYIVPNFSNPSGYTLTMDRRRHLVEVANRYHTLIIEDDPYGELRLEGESIPTLYEIAQDIPGAENSVIYLSTFSKILAPGLRTGWIITPECYYDSFAVAKQAIDLHTNTLSQRIISRYMESGRLLPHISLLRNAYIKRRNALVSALKRHIGDNIKFYIPSGGMFLWVHLMPDINSSELLVNAIKQNVTFVPGEHFFADSPDVHMLRLSYSNITPEIADEAATRLMRALQHIKL